MDSGKETKNKGKIICTRIISYNEILHLIKSSGVKSALQGIMESEQQKWQDNNPKSSFANENLRKMKFLADCFPNWIYALNNKQYTAAEASAANIIPSVIWDIQLNVEHDQKLKAYIILKGNEEKESEDE